MKTKSKLKSKKRRQDQVIRENNKIYSSKFHEPISINFKLIESIAKFNHRDRHHRGLSAHTPDPILERFHVKVDQKSYPVFTKL